MNYVKRYKALGNAIVNAFKDRTWEERHAEVDKLGGYIKEMIDERTEIISEQVTIMMKGGEGKWTEHLENICRCAKGINSMCSRYGVEPMFPEAESCTEPGEVAEAFQTYINQLGKIDRLTRDSLEEAFKTGNFDDYNKYYDQLVENIEEIMSSVC